MYFNTAALARRLETEWTEAFLPFGLTPPQAFMLRAVLGQPGQTQVELARAMAISKATATRALDGLAAKGFVDRLPSERDAREWSIYPTPAATGIHAGLNRASGEVTQRLKRRLGPGEFAATVAGVRKARAALE